MAGKFEAASVNDLIKGAVGSASRFKRNMKSIIEKYDREFADDDVIDLYSMTIVQPGNGGNGVLRKSKPRIFGASKLKTTKRKEVLLKSRLNSQPCEFDPNVSMAIARECKSVMEASGNLPQEPSDAETLSSHDEADDDDDNEDDLEGSVGDISEDEEGDNDEISFEEKDFESLYSHSMGHLKTKQNESNNDNEGYVTDSDTKEQCLMGDETYDADEEDFVSSEVDLGKDSLSEIRFEKWNAHRLAKESTAREKKLKGSGQRETIAGGNASFLLTNTINDQEDASPNDSFVSISSSASRHQSQRKSALNQTSVISPSNRKKSINEMFIVSSGSVASSERGNKLRSHVERPFVASKNVTQTSPSLSSNGFDTLFISPHKAAAKRIPESLMRKSSASTRVGSEKYMLNKTSSKAVSHISEDSQKSVPSKKMGHSDSSCFQDATNTSKSFIANIPHLRRTDCNHTSKAIQVGSPVDFKDLRGKPNCSFEESRKDEVKTIGMNLDCKLGRGMSVEFSSDSDEYEQEILDISKVLPSDSDMKKKPENNSLLHSLKPSWKTSKINIPQGQSGHTTHLDSLVAGKSANCGYVNKAHHDRDGNVIYARFIDKRSSIPLHQNTSEIVKHQLMARRQDHVQGWFSPPQSGLQRQQSTSRTSGYQTDVSSIPVSKEPDEGLKQNLTYSIVSSESSNECNEKLPLVPCENPKVTKTENSNLTYDISSSPKTDLYHTDISKLLQVPRKPIKFNQQKLMMARKRYKPPEYKKSTSNFQCKGPSFSNQAMPCIQDKDTDSRVSQWVKNITEAQFAHPCHFSSCPPKISSSFLTCVSPHLAHMQVGTDHSYEKDRHPVNSICQSNGCHSLLGEGHNKSSDISDSWKSPPAKVRKLNNHLECSTKLSATLTSKEPNCDSKSETAPSIKKCSFYYSGKCRLETSSFWIDDDKTQHEEDSKDEHLPYELHNKTLDRTTISNNHNNQDFNKSLLSKTSESKSTHFLSMNEEEFVQRISSHIVKNIKKCLYLDSFLDPINRSNDCRKTTRHGLVKNSVLNQPTGANFKPQKCMFPEEYINMFSPSNPNRIDSDEAVRIEQEVASSALDFKQCLRSFRPRRHQQRNSHPKLPIENKNREVTGNKTIARSPQKDTTFSGDILCGHKSAPEIVKETFQFKKPLHSLSKRKYHLAVSTEKKLPREMADRDLPAFKPFKSTPYLRSSTPKPFQMTPDTDCPNSSLSTIVTPSVCGPLETENVESISLNGSFDTFEEEDEDQDISLVE